MLITNSKFIGNAYTIFQTFYVQNEIGNIKTF